MIKKDVDITGYEKWNVKLAISKIDWIKSFKILKLSCKDTKLYWLQFRINHSTLTTDRSVSKYNGEQSHLCTFCKGYSETIQHLFWTCPKVNIFWKNIERIINNRCAHSHNFHFNEKLVLFGHSAEVQTDIICDLIGLIAKYYIYRCKVQKKDLSITVFIKELYNRYCIEKEIYKNNVVFRNRWGPYLNIFKALQVPNSN